MQSLQIFQLELRNESSKQRFLRNRLTDRVWSMKDVVGLAEKKEIEAAAQKPSVVVLCESIPTPGSAGPLPIQIGATPKVFRAANFPTRAPWIALYSNKPSCPMTPYL